MNAMSSHDTQKILDLIAGKKLITSPSVLEKDGGVSISAELQKIVALFDDGTLLVSSSHKTDRDVQGFQARIKCMKSVPPIKSYYVPISLLQQIYQEAAGGSAELVDATITQQEVIKLIRDAVNMNASDIHFVISKTTDIRFRIDGLLTTVRSTSKERGEDLVGTIYQSMMDVAEEVFKPMQSQDGRMKGEFLSQCGLYGARFASRPTDGGLLVVLRLLRDRRQAKASDEPQICGYQTLGYSQDHADFFEHMMSRTVGVNILSGPTGSGKSTTLETTMNRILQRSQGHMHLMTIEDPPEAKMPGAVQTPILCDHDDDAAVSAEWARSISNAMRLDPDLLMIGEIRDASSAQAALRCAMTGHPVWTTLHANDAVFILRRLEDIGVDIGLLTDPKIITGLVNQSLVPVLCPHCKKPYLGNEDQMDVGLRKRLTSVLEPEKLSGVFITGPGCDHCKNTGVKGRTVVAEVIVPTKKFMDVYRIEGPAAARQYWVSHMNGKTKCQHILSKVASGMLDPKSGELVLALDEDLITLDD